MTSRYQHNVRHGSAYHSSVGYGSAGHSSVSYGLVPNPYHNIEAKTIEKWANANLSILRNLYYNLNNLAKQYGKTVIDFESFVIFCYNYRLIF